MVVIVTLDCCDRIGILVNSRDDWHRRFAKSHRKNTRYYQIGEKVKKLITVLVKILLKILKVHHSLISF